MIKPTPRDSLSFITRIAQACAKFLNQMESAFRGTLERIYAAHLENAAGVGIEDQLCAISSPIVSIFEKPQEQ